MYLTFNLFLSSLRLPDQNAHPVNVTFDPTSVNPLTCLRGVCTAPVQTTEHTRDVPHSSLSSSSFSTSRPHASCLLLSLSSCASHFTFLYMSVFLPLSSLSVLPTSSLRLLFSRHVSLPLLPFFSLCFTRSISLPFLLSPFHRLSLLLVHSPSLDYFIHGSLVCLASLPPVFLPLNLFSLSSGVFLSSFIFNSVYTSCSPTLTPSVYIFFSPVSLPPSIFFFLSLSICSPLFISVHFSTSLLRCRPSFSFSPSLSHSSFPSFLSFFCSLSCLLSLSPCHLFLSIFIHLLFVYPSLLSL